MSTHKEPCGCTHDGKHTWKWCPKHEAEHKEAFARAERDYRARWAREDLAADLL